MQKPPQQTRFFDEFVLDLTRGCLRHGPNKIRLRPQSFEVLKYLVENCGRLISKDELIGAIWVDTSVTDDSVVQCLKDIRHALCDEAQRIIKTVHGRGYIFDTEVRDTGAARMFVEDTAGVRITIEDLETNEAAIMPLAIKRGADSQTLTKTTRRIVRLMVLPFRMLRADPDVDFLAFSVPDAVAGALSLLDSVVVRSPTGAALYANELLDLKRVAEEAHAEAILTGTILRVGEGIRVTCELMEVPSGTVLWWDEPHVR